MGVPPCLWNPLQLTLIGDDLIGSHDFDLSRFDSAVEVLTRYGSDASCLTDVMRAALIYPTIAEAQRGVMGPGRFMRFGGLQRMEISSLKSMF